MLTEDQATTIANDDFFTGSPPPGRTFIGRPVATFDQALDDLKAAFEAALHTANRTDERQQLAGERAYCRARLAQTCRRQLRDVIEVLRHPHKWDGNDYCMICGNDGRA